MRALGLGVVSLNPSRNALTALQYVWRIQFVTRDIPKLRASHWLPSFPS